jgi:hypothetical protein
MCLRDAWANDIKLAFLIHCFGLLVGTPKTDMPDASEAAEERLD